MPGNLIDWPVSRLGASGPRRILPFGFGGQTTACPRAIRLRVFPTDIHNRHLVLAPAWVEVWSGGHCFSCTCRETFVRPHRNFRLSQPETFRDGHLVRRFLVTLTFAVPRRATHLKAAQRNPHVL